MKGNESEGGIVTPLSNESSCADSNIWVERVKLRETVTRSVNEPSMRRVPMYWSVHVDMVNIPHYTDKINKEEGICLRKIRH